MILFGVTMVKDELDVIEYTLRHLVGAGVDEIIVADNMSTDGTRELLAELADELPVTVVDDLEPAYYQSDKMTRLVRNAAVAGADRVIPFDADELWRAETGTLKEAFERHQWPIYGAELRNHFPTSGDDPTEPNPFRRITQRDPAPAPLPKVAVRPLADMEIHQGNHGAHCPVAHEPKASPLRVEHYPWRSFEQFVKKCRNGAAAYAATDLPESVGAHWRSYGRILNDFGEDALRTDVWEQWFFDPPLQLEYAPDLYEG